MKLHVKYDIHAAGKAILKEQLELAGLSYKAINFGEVELINPVSPEKLAALNENLKTYGIEIFNDQKTDIIQKTKDVIVEMVNSDENLPAVKVSAYIAQRVNYSYGYLAALFSEVTFTSIENFIILQKIERVKQMILEGDLTLTEIAFKLHYSSVAHLSAQFKKTTGLTPTSFLSIIKKRRANNIH
jgi:AraC-like DNA-binding protein